MKKILIQKKDGIPAIIQKILDCRELEIILFIPIGSLLEEKGGEFYLILREAKAVNKQISINTQSEKIIEYALAAGIKVENLPSSKSKKTLTDVIPQKTSQVLTKLRFKNDFIKPDLADKVDKADDKSRDRFSHLDFSFSQRLKKSLIADKKIDEITLEDEPLEDESLKDKPIIRKFNPVFILLLIFALVLTISAVIFLPRLNVHLVFEKTNWSFQDELIAAVRTENLTEGKIIIPAQLFRLDKTLVYQAPATGEKYVENKATGKIVVYNAYSSSRQPLVKNTRFVTPDGKIFRLIKDVMIPGAEVREGRIIPSSIEVEIIADQPGEAYNVGPINVLRIPGFHGGPRYEGFYGELKEPTKGGFIGNMRVATERDITLAKETASQKIKETLDFEILNRIPEGFKILNNADSFQILEEKIGETVSAEGEFEVLVYAEKRILAFREEDLINGLRQRFFEEKQVSDVDFVLRNYQLSYQLYSADFKNNILRLSMDFNSQWINSFDKTALQEKLAAKKEPEIRSAVLSLVGVDRVKIELSPFWVRTSPKDLSRIEISFE